MLHPQDAIQKLETLLNYYQLNASSFADKIGVQRSSLSHILSGRNKPSLEFVVKIAQHFPEMDLDWFLLNKGSFPKQTASPIEAAEKELIQLPTKLSEQVAAAAHASGAPATPTTVENKAIESVMVFYKDGSFKQYVSEN